MSVLARIRLDRLLSGLGYGSRREVSGRIRRGLFELDGVVISSPEFKIDLDKVRHGKPFYDGEPLDPLPPLTILVNKPAGYVCSHDDPGLRIYDLLPPRFVVRNPPVAVAGRLDKETTGLVVMTDDGDLAHRLISPRTDTPKVYKVEMELPPCKDMARIFASGTLILNGEDKPLKPAQLEMTGEKTAIITVHEGKYHQVRRMFASQGNNVVSLHRISVGKYELGDLEEGSFRICGTEEAT